MTKDISDCALKENDFPNLSRTEEEKISDQIYQAQNNMFLLRLGYLVVKPHPKIIKEYGLPPYK
jgi:hypothetical protein